MDAPVTDQPGSIERRPSAARAGTPLFAFLLVAVNLRIAVVALSPLLDDIKATEHLTDSAAGLLTTLPLACFGAFAFLVPWLTRRLGDPRRWAAGSASKSAPRSPVQAASPPKA